MQNFRLSTAQIKFHQMCTLIDFFYWKYIKFQLKKVQMSYVSWYWRVEQNLKKKRFFVSKITKIWWILIRALRSLKNLPFDWSFLCQVYNVWPKKVRRSCNSWHCIEEPCKIWRRNSLWFGKWHEKLGKFSSKHLTVSKLVPSWDSFV